MRNLIKKIEKYYKSKQSSLFFYPLACLLYESGAKEEAFDLLVEGVAKFPHYLLALIKVAQILIDEEKYEAAESYLETALNINNSNVLAWELLAVSYEKQNKIEQVINAYEKLLVLNPSPKIKSKLLSFASFYTPSVEKVKENLAQTTNIQTPLKSKETDANDIVILDVEKPGETTQQGKDPHNLEQNKPIVFEDIPTIDLEEDDQLNIAKLYVEQGYIEDAKNLYKEILTRNPQNRQAKIALEALDEKQ
ncbi:TPR repeat [Desulfurella amilsii]|uniref:TPR repeat n=1 Tax=Desulfurella amilsii TaxID=1562698 RepID=A0A1X4XXN9_9BACT|nr:tetratricopeptide repeat protein [Desulfurella amilsii]OSS42297.1 TPR repeat [Desulfurella amilsii]